MVFGQLAQNQPTDGDAEKRHWLSDCGGPSWSVQVPADQAGSLGARPGQAKQVGRTVDG
jgi:hypothetical protein